MKKWKSQKMKLLFGIQFILFLGHEVILRDKRGAERRYMFLLSDWLHHSARATIAAGRCRSQVGLFFLWLNELMMMAQDYCLFCAFCFGQPCVQWFMSVLCLPRDVTTCILRLDTYRKRIVYKLTFLSNHKNITQTFFTSLGVWVPPPGLITDVIHMQWNSGRVFCI